MSGDQGSEHETCQRCRGPNAVATWFVPSPLWNLVMRGNDIAADARFGDLVCIPCFIACATEAGVGGTWRLTIDPLPDGLVYETPSGRVWDDAIGLWVTPPDPDLWDCAKCGQPTHPDDLTPGPDQSWHADPDLWCETCHDRRDP